MSRPSIRTETPNERDGVTLQLRVLGEVALFDSSGALVEIRSDKVRAILLLLSVAPRMTCTRGHLANALWSDAGEDRARQSLRQALSRLRGFLEEANAPALIVNKDTIRLDAERVSVDVAELLASVRSNDAELLARVAASYRGDFGAGLALTDEPFEEWLLPERVRMREAAITVGDRLVRLLAQQGRSHEALSHALWLLKIDPLREETHRLVLRQEALVAGRASALARYEQFCQLLDTELGVGPEVETRRLAESFRSDPVEVVVSAAKPLASMASILSLGDRPQATPPSFAPPARSPRRRFRWYGLVGTAAGIAALVLLYAPPLPVFRAGSHDVGEEGGRISMSVLPFQVSAKNPELERLATTLHGDVVRAIARDSRLSVVHAPAETVANMPRKIGEALHVRYLLAIDVGNPSQGIQGGIQLWDTATGVSFRSVLSDIRADDEEQLRRDFTREVLARLETALQRARQLEAVDKAAAAADAAVIPVCAGAFSSRFDAGRFFTETTRRTAAG